MTSTPRILEPDTLRLSALEQRLLEVAKQYLDSRDGLDRANLPARDLTSRLIVALMHPSGFTL